MSRKIKIFDTTLRDGEQSPGCSMNLKEKLEMAKQLDKMGVDIIEAGFAAASPGDFESVKEISKVIEHATVASLARTLEGDIDKAWEAIKEANHPRIHVFLATSDIHMEYKLKMSRDEVKKRVANMVAYAKKYCDDIEFSAEDATRSDIPFLCEVLEEAIKAGARTLNIPDTVGYTTPEEHFEFVKAVKENTKGIENIDISVHCHNDLGLGVANSIAGVRAGASQIECTINGIGERAGNAALEEIVMAFNTREDLYGFTTNVVTTEIMKSSNLLSQITGVKVQPNKAIVGENAFAHESGIHQHGMLNNSKTYEIMTPESVGLIEKNTLVLGKHSGKHAFQNKITEMGYTLSNEELQVVFEKFKVLADKKKKVYDKDIEALISKEAVQVPKTYTLERFVINSGNTITATAVLTVRKLEALDGEMGKGKLIEKVSRGDGPIDASFKAIEKIVGKDLKVEDYQLQSITEGEDALGDALVKLEYKGEIFTGRGLSTDVIEASILAYMNAVNKIIYSGHH